MKKQTRKFRLLIFLLVKWSGIGMVDGRNKIGGTVLSTSRGGATARNKVTPVNPQSPSQGERRSIFSLFSQNWRALSQAQRNTWITAAANGFTYTNIFGDTKKRSGINLYIGLNTNLGLVDVAALTEAPVQGSVSNPISITPAGAAGANTLFLNADFGAGVDVVPADTAVVVLASGAVSAGINFVKSQLRIIDFIDAAGDTGTTNLNTAYEAVFGVQVAGQKIFLAAVAINKTTGQAGVLFKQSLIVAA